MFMARNVGNGIALQEGCTQARQRFVLTRFKAVRSNTFKFNANRVVIAIAASPVIRNPRMPSALVDADKLLEFTVATDVKVRRYFQALDTFEIRVRIPVKLIGKQP